jgi:hypothetical protein
VPPPANAGTRPRRAALPHATTLSVGRAGHNAALAVADVAHEHGAAVGLLGAIGPRPGDLAQLLRQRATAATPTAAPPSHGPTSDVPGQIDEHAFSMRRPLVDVHVPLLTPELVA